MILIATFMLFYSKKFKKIKYIYTALVFDNVNIHLLLKQTSREKERIMKTMVQVYAAVDRIPPGHLDDK